MEGARYLSEQIGPRLAGSAKEFEASEFIANEFRNLGLQVSAHRFSFLNWTPISRPTMQILEPVSCSFVLAPMAYTMSSPSYGVEGVLKRTGKMVLIPKLKEWDRYAIEKDGQEEAFVVKNPAEGEASPFPSGRPLLPEIGAILSKEDGETIDGWLTEGKQVRVRLFNECVQEPAYSRNIVGHLGDGYPELVVCAHYDSAFLAPGAVDNGSGVQALLDVAKQIVEKGTTHTIQFIAMGAEELGLLGAYAYVHYLQEHNTINNIRACVNFDMIGCGKEIHLRTGIHMEETIDTLIEQYQGKLHHTARRVPVTSTSDNWPFHETGIRNMQFVASPFPVYHLPCDTMEKYDPTLVEDCEKMAITLIDMLLDEAIGDKL